MRARRWQGVLDLWGAASAGPLTPDGQDGPVGCGEALMQILLARLHLAVEESAHHVGPALDALDVLLDRPAAVEDLVTAVLGPVVAGVAVSWAEQLWGTAALAVASGRDPRAVDDLLCRARALARGYRDGPVEAGPGRATVVVAAVQPS